MGVEARVIAPGVDVEAFSPGPGRSEEPAILFAAAPEEPRKRIGLLLEAFELVRRERPRGAPPGLPAALPRAWWILTAPAWSCSTSTTAMPWWRPIGPRGCRRCRQRARLSAWC